MPKVVLLSSSFSRSEMILIPGDDCFGVTDCIMVVLEKSGSISNSLHDDAPELSLPIIHIRMVNPSKVNYLENKLRY